jgi:AcrR family transcriptional regulator
LHDFILEKGYVKTKLADVAESADMSASHLLNYFKAKDAAELSYSLMIGLRSAVYFDDDIDLAEAHRLFLSSMLSMSGLE